MKQEADAKTREAAIKTRELFEALADAGFTEYQALVILGHALGTAAKS